MNKFLLSFVLLTAAILLSGRPVRAHGHEAACDAAHIQCAYDCWNFWEGPWCYDACTRAWNQCMASGGCMQNQQGDWFCLDVQG